MYVHVTCTLAYIRSYVYIYAYIYIYRCSLRGLVVLVALVVADYVRSSKIALLLLLNNTVPPSPQERRTTVYRPKTMGGGCCWRIFTHL